jgi:hypothetical protein
VTSVRLDPLLLLSTPTLFSSSTLSRVTYNKTISFRISNLFKLHVYPFFSLEVQCKFINCNPFLKFKSFKIEVVEAMCVYINFRDWKNLICLLWFWF